MNTLLPLLHDLSSALKKAHWQLATAESCTGGLIASALTELPGSSSWFERGFVTYSNLSKQELLNVPDSLIASYGAVSIQVAEAMALGALANSAAQIALSVTGIAGPDGGSEDKPVGTVCFAWATSDGAVHGLKKQFTGSRSEIRHAACHQALQGALVLLKSL